MAQTQPSSPIDVNWNQLGAGALVALPSYIGIVALWRFYTNRERTKDTEHAADLAERDRVIAEDRAEIARLNADMVGRERILNERTVPAFERVASALSRTPQAIRSSLEESSRAVPSGRADEVISKLEDVAERLERRADNPDRPRE